MEVLIDNRDGIIWNEPVTKVSYKTNRIGKAGEVEVTLIIEDPLKYPIENGAVIRIEDGKYKVFYGYVFDVGLNDNSEVTVKAYDQLRYLMFNDTFVLKAMTAAAATKKIAGDAKLKLGTFEDSKYIVPARVEDDKQALDVIGTYLDSSLIANNILFVLRDDFGSLNLRRIESYYIKPENWYLGDESLMFGFEYKKSIDSDTYNKIKLVKDDKEASKRKVFLAQDSKNIAKWGQLQYFKKVDDNMTDAQIKDLLNRLLLVKNKELKELTIKCLGNWSVKAGNMIHILIEKIGVNTIMLVEECSHEWSETVHTMNLKLKVVS